MVYTKFGEYFKILRIKHNEVLGDAKKFLNVSSAFISSVECGKKSIPEDWYLKIVEHYNLNEKEQIELQNAIDMSKKQVKIDLSNATNLQKNVCLQFQRSFNEVDDETLKEIQNLLKRRDIK